MNPILSYRCYRKFLGAQLAARCAKNPAYSQRAFARDLKLLPGHFNGLLRGKKGLSHTAAVGVASALGLSRVEKTYFIALVDQTHARNATVRAEALALVERLSAHQRFKNLQLETFKLIADWHHFAILEYFKIRGAKRDTASIAARFQLATDTVDKALQRLERLGFIERRSDRIRLIRGQTTTAADISAESVREFHAQTLAQAHKSLLTEMPERHEFNTTILAIDAARFPEVREKVQAFWREICATMATSKSKNSVYCLGVQFCELTKN